MVLKIQEVSCSKQLSISLGIDFVREQNKTLRMSKLTKIERFLLTEQHEPVSHYCHAVRCGEHIWISGMVGIDPEGRTPLKTFDQFEIAIKNLDSVLREAGGKPEHIVKVTVFLTNISDRSVINPIRQRYFGEHRPASTLVEVSKLVLPELTVEIEAQAVVVD